MERAVKEYRRVMPGVVGDNGVIKVSIGGKMRTKSGVNGDPTLATVEKGEQVLDAMARDMVTYLQHFADLPLPDEA
jgi:creatinine amidohydrolase/Fe(II)-dependent formamide hydrolase-like protein